MSKELLHVDKLHVAFNGKTVVNNISFSVHQGEKLAIVGESGSGKSVTAMSLLQLIPGAKLQGQAVFNGVNLLDLQTDALQGIRGKDISVIFQEPMTALNPLYSIGEQIAEVYRVKLGLSAKAAWTEAIARLDETGIPEPARRAHAYPHQLSGGQRQRAMIAMALACKPQLLLADEPTTALDVTLRLQILDLLDDLQKAHGMAIVMITHDLHLVKRFADRVVVMQNGHIVEHGNVGDVFNHPQHPYTQKLLASRTGRDITVLDEDQTTAPVIASKHVQIQYRVPGQSIRDLFRQQWFSAVNDASFSLGQGKTLGIIGESGSGKSTLAQAILGLLKYQGEILIDGASWPETKKQGFTAQKQLRKKIQAVFQDPYSSLSPRMRIQQIVGESLAFHEPELSKEAQTQRVIRVLTDVGLTEEQFPNLLNRFPHEFSGGQRQRIAIARAIITHPDILVLDEPTSALDVTIQKQVLSLLQKLQREYKLSYFLITHDMDVIYAMAHHVIVMKGGDIVEQGSVDQILTAAQHPYTRTLIDASSLADGLPALVPSGEEQLKLIA